MYRPVLLTVTFGVLLIAGCSDTSDSQPDDVAQAPAALQESAEIQAMRSRLESLRSEVERVRDSNDIKRLQRAFGYYMDKGLWNEIVDLFAEDATLEYARDGLYRGKDRIREYFRHMGGGQQGLRHGQLNEHFQLMPVITLSEDGNSAKGRWRDLILKGEHGEYAWWGEGPFENEYVKEEGVWKISKLHWFQTVMVPYEGGWTENEDVNQGIYVSDVLPPDEPQTIPYEPWPETFLPPFHFENPVAGPYSRMEAAQ